jgi:hypothetical protein
MVRLQRSSTLTPSFASFGHQPAEVRIHLRCATGQVDQADLRCADEVEHAVQGVQTHLFGARRSRIDVAVQATLVAGVAQIELQDIGSASADRRKVGADEQGQGGVHGWMSG